MIAPLLRRPFRIANALWPRAILVLFAVAVVLRIGFVLLYPPYPFGQGDDLGYDQVGWNLAIGKGFSGSLELPDVAGSPEIRYGPSYLDRRIYDGK